MTRKIRKIDALAMAEHAAARMVRLDIFARPTEGNASSGIEAPTC